MSLQVQPPALADDVATAFAAFEQRYPAYAETRKLDELRRDEYSRLDRLGHTYLDFTGGGLYAESQVRQHTDLLLNDVFGNPHSHNPTSLAATELVERTRRRVLDYFHAAPDEYDVIFTQNATGALKLLGESYPFAPGDQFLLTFDNHNSVNGIRVFARDKGAQVTYVPAVPPDMRAARDAQRDELRAVHGVGHWLDSTLPSAFARARTGGHNLFAFPAQSNFSGVQHPLTWIAEAQDAGWDVLLDAAAFVPTNRLDLSQWHPDFVDISFYKIFGYPTGIGCLIARKDALAKLHRPWFAGGTLSHVAVEIADDPEDTYYLTPGTAGFEDGTVNYVGIPALGIGMDFIEAIGIETIHERVMCLTGWLLEQLRDVRHDNGTPAIHIYGPLDTQMRGGTISMNFHDPQGRLIDSRIVENRANRRQISLRSGCHCNPGAREIALGISEEELTGIFRDAGRITFDQFLQVIDGKTTGAARVSLGVASTFADVYRFVEFAHTFVNTPLADV